MKLYLLLVLYLNRALISINYNVTFYQPSQVAMRFESQKLIINSEVTRIKLKYSPKRQRRIINGSGLSVESEIVCQMPACIAKIAS